MKKYIIISHSHCTDGLCSASLMKKALQHFIKGGKLDQEEVDRITFQNPIEF